MYNIIEKYINKMSIDDINNFALKKNIVLSESELLFTYDFIKKNYQTLLSNPILLDLERYQHHYTKENFSKITKVFQEYFQKYSRYL